MDGEKMDITKEYLKLFMQSLPEGCKFQIISFGSDYEVLEYKGQEIPMEYTDENVKVAKEAIEDFDANLGGTEIFGPLEFVFK